MKRLDDNERLYSKEEIIKQIDECCNGTQPDYSSLNKWIGRREGAILNGMKQLWNYFRAYDHYREKVLSDGHRRTADNPDLINDEEFRSLFITLLGSYLYHVETDEMLEDIIQEICSHIRTEIRRPGRFSDDVTEISFTHQREFPAYVYRQKNARSGKSKS